MKGLKSRGALLWLGVAAGIALGLIAFMVLPSASNWQSAGNDEEVIDLTNPDLAGATRVPQEDRQQAAPKQPTVRPSPKGRQDGLSTLPAPIVILNSGIVTHNSQMVARGFGFEPYEDVLISLYGPSGDLESNIGLIRADKDGNFSDAKFGVAVDLAPGEHTVVVLGQTSGATGEASFRVQSSGPWLALDSYSEKPQSHFTFNGGGFDPGEEVDLHFDSVASQAIGTVLADEYGGLSKADARVPVLGPGEHSFILVGRESKTVVSSPFTVLGFHPWVGLSSYSPQPEQSIGFSGRDFAPGERVSFFMNEISAQAIGTVTADEYGNFDTQNSFEIPVDAVGEIVLVFLGHSSQVSTEVTVIVLPFGPGLELSTYAGPPGTKVSFIGQGFARNEAIHVYIGKVGGREVASFRTDEYGKFSGAGEFAIPFDIGSGTVTFTAVGDNSGVPIALEFAVLEVVPWVGLSEYTAPPGTVITFTGNAFGLGETVNIYAGNDRSQPIATAQADENGAFAEVGPYVIPEDAKGEIDFTFIGEQTRATVSATFTVAEWATGGEAQSNEEAEPSPSPSPSP